MLFPLGGRFPVYILGIYCRKPTVWLRVGGGVLVVYIVGIILIPCVLCGGNVIPTMCGHISWIMPTCMVSCVYSGNIPAGNLV